MKSKSILLTAILSLLMLSGLFAQEKYEFAIVKQFGKEVVFISKDKIDKIPISGGDNEIFQATISLINTLSGEWEVYNSSEVSTTNFKGYTYYLRKKKN